MSKNVAQWPGQVWDGTTPVRDSRDIDRIPDYEDYDQQVAEMIAVQDELYNMKYLSLINASGGTLAVATPVYQKADASGCAGADANGATVLTQPMGLVAEASATLEATKVQRQGRLELTTAEWDANTGDTGGLVAGREYYVSGTAAKITKTRPATTGDIIVSVGIAISVTVLDINIVFRGISA